MYLGPFVITKLQRFIRSPQHECEINTSNVNIQYGTEYQLASSYCSKSVPLGNVAKARVTNSDDGEPLIITLFYSLPGPGVAW